MRKGLFLVFISLWLVGCHPLDKGVHVDNRSNNEIDTAEQLFEKDHRLVRSAIVLQDEKLVSAVTVKTFSRFHKRKIEKELKKKLEQEYPEHEVTVSADYKAMYMLSKIIEQEEQENKKVEEQLDEIVKLLKEET